MDEARRSVLKRLLIVPATSALYACVPFLAGCRQESASAGDTGAGSAEDVCTSETELDPIAQCEATGADMKGPFHESGAPVKSNIAAADEPGEPLIVQGQVLASGCKERIAESVLDVWQANANGDYYNKPGVYRLRGKVNVDCEGRFAFRTVLPGAYLTGGGFRPKHIHIIIDAPGYSPLTTQLYFAGDPYLKPSDSCNGCQSGDATHIIALTGATIDGKAGWTGQFNVVLT